MTKKENRKFEIPYSSKIIERGIDINAMQDITITTSLNIKKYQRKDLKNLVEILYVILTEITIC